MTELQTRLDPRRHAGIRQMLVSQAAPPAPVPRRRRAALAGVLGAVVATGVVTVAVWPDPAPPDYAGWTAIPQAAPPLTAPRHEVVDWASTCSDLGVGGVAVEGIRARPARRDVLVDRRGGVTYCVDVALGSGTASEPLIALSGIRRRDGLNGMEATVSDKPFTRPGAAEILVLGGAWQAPPPVNGPPSEILQVYGLSGPAVTGVDVILANGLRITATVRAGIWGMWWPRDRGDATGCRLEVRTAAGVTPVEPAEVQFHIG